MLFRAVILSLLLAAVAPLAGQHVGLPEHLRVVERQRWFLDQRSYPADTIPNTYVVHTLNAERNQQKKMLQQPGLHLYSWELLGPSTSGGRMTSISVHPLNPNVWIAGSGGGGVWRTVNRGATWQQLATRDFPVYAVGAVAYHPRFPDEIYAGTGEPNFASFTFAGAGIMRSTDGGLSWSPRGTTSLKGAIADIVVHPDNPDLLFAACSGFGDIPGVYRSINRGQTWQRVLEGTSTMDIALHPTRRNIVYAVLSYPLGNSSNGVYRSLDTGLTWTKLDGALPAETGRMALAVTPAAPDRLYVLVSQTNGQLEGLFVSADTGATFTKMGFLPSNVLGYQGWYNLAIAVSPTTVNDLTVGGVHLYRSTSAGSSWTEIEVHPDQHAAHYLTADSVIIANDGGMYTARNFQGTSHNTGLATTQFYDIGVPASGRIFGGTQDNGSHMWIGGTWSATQLGGDVMRAIAHPGIGGMLFASAPYGLIFKSTTDGQTWFSSTNGIDYSRPSVWKAPLLLSPVSGQGSTLFTATTRVYRSVDLAASWQEISDDLATGLYSITALAQARTDANIVVAASQNGKVFYTRTAGNTWSDISFGLPDRFPTALAVHPADKRTFVVVYSGYGAGHVWRTTNQGANWQNVTGTLPDLPVNCFLFDPTLPDSKWYVGTDFGVYYTLNAGQTWLPLTLGMGIAPIADLEIVQNTGDLFAATFGMGIFRAKIDLLPVELANFEGRQHGNDVLLTWETASERNNAFFLAERSIDGEVFEIIGRAEGHGNSSVLWQYSLLDSGAALGHADRLYYRLVQVDVDGTQAILPTIEVNMMSPVFLDDRLASAPNPFSGATTVQYRLQRSSPVTMVLYSALGSRVRQFFQNVRHNSGVFSVVWDGRDDNGADMPAGLYMLRLEVHGVSTTIPVIKQ